MTKAILLQVICDTTETDIRDVLMKPKQVGARKSELVHARSLFFYFAYQEYKMGSQSEISSYLDRDHVTLLTALKTLKNDIETNRYRREMFNRVKKALANKDVDLELKNGDYFNCEISSEALSYQTNLSIKP